MALEVESDVPVRKPMGRQQSEITKTLLTMYAGQSVFVPGLRVVDMGGRIKTARLRGLVIVVRKEVRDDGTRGVRLHVEANPLVPVPDAEGAAP